MTKDEPTLEELIAHQEDVVKGGVVLFDAPLDSDVLRNPVAILASLKRLRERDADLFAGDLVNKANISATDLPHQVVQKLIDAHRKERGEP